MFGVSPVRFWLTAVVVVTMGALVPVVFAATASGRRSVERLQRRYGTGFWTIATLWVALVVLVWTPFVAGAEFTRLRLLAGGLAIAAGLLLVGYAVANLPTYIRVRATPTTDVASAAPGLVELEGTARVADAPGASAGPAGTSADAPAASTGENGPPAEAGGPLTAPLSGEDAICYQISIQQREEHGSKRGWKQVHFADERVPFVLQDYVGRATVDVDGADFRLEAETRIETDPDEDPPETVRSYLDSTPDLGPATIRRKYAEQRLEPGSDVYVLGEARYDSAGRLVVGDGTEFVVKPGDAASVTADFHRGVVYGGLAGLALVALGEAILLWSVL